MFHFSDTWQLVINTSTTIVTFLMVFLIQNNQNRDSESIQIKLDDLIRSMDRAKNALLDLEELEEADLDRIRADYEKLAEFARMELRKVKIDTTVLDLSIKAGNQKRKKVKRIQTKWKKKLICGEL